MKPIWSDRFKQDALGQPVRTQRALLGPLRDAARVALGAEHWTVKALFTAALSTLVAFATTRIAAKHEDPTQVRDIKELDARVALLELRLKALEVEASKPVGIDTDHHGVTGTQNQAALNADAHQQAAAKP